AYFVGTRCYIVDRLDKDKLPVHAVKYAHDDDSIPDFDEKGPKHLIEEGKAVRAIRLTKPPIPKPPGSTRTTTTGHVRKDNSRTFKIPRGAKRRAIAAGINFGQAK